MLGAVQRGPMGTFEGGIAIRLALVGGCASSVEIASGRPARAAAIFEGRHAEEAVALVPRLYAVCGTAQQVAAKEAIEHAAGAERDRAQRECRCRLVALEMAREHLGRVFWDWPRALGQPPVRQALQRAHRMLGEVREAVLASPASAEPVQDGEKASRAFSRAAEELTGLIGQALGVAPAWVTHASSLAALQRWLQGADPSAPAAAYLRELRDSGLARWGSTTVAPLPELDHQALARCLASDERGRYVGQPRWGGRTRETGPLARQRGSPLVRAIERRYGSAILAREVARVVELAALPELIMDSLAVEASAPYRGAGLAGVDAARGRLYHYVELDARGVIERYRILAPTEWNFHPRGLLAEALAGAAYPEQEVAAEQVVRRLVAAVDPCVGCQVEVWRA